MQDGFVIGVSVSFFTQVKQMAFGGFLDFLLSEPFTFSHAEAEGSGVRGLRRYI